MRLYFPYLSSSEKRAGLEYFVCSPHTGHTSLSVYLPQEHFLIFDTIVTPGICYQIILKTQVFGSLCLKNSPVPPDFCTILMAASDDFLRILSAFL